MKIVFWGTYDTGKPRNRILIRGLRENNVDLLECHSHVWSGVEDKSQLKGFFSKIKFVLTWVLSYPSLVIRYLLLPKHDTVIVGYLGQLDVLVIWPFAKMRGAKIVWDAFLSIYDTVVNDRKLATAKSLKGRLLYWLEWLSCRAADLVLLDTKAHSELFAQLFKLNHSKTASVWVGVEPEKFPIAKQKYHQNQKEDLNVLFYGQFIPLHGIPFIIEAARLLKNERVTFTLIGIGQERERVLAMMEEEPLDKVIFIDWVDYGKLHHLIAKADVCLGIFGDSAKASRVIPNKVFQIVQSGKPLITMDSPAIRELFADENTYISLIEPASSEALADAIIYFLTNKDHLFEEAPYSRLREKINPQSVGKMLVELLG